MSEAAAEKLSSHFVAIRKQVHQVEENSNERSTIPITVRQLEAIVRTSEALAKMYLRVTVTEEDVDEAIRLFQASTMNAALQSTTETTEEIRKIEETLTKRLPLGFTANYATVVADFINGVRRNDDLTKD